MIHPAETDESHSKEFFVQPNGQLDENPQGYGRFSDFRWREPASPGRETLELSATHREQHHTDFVDSRTGKLAVLTDRRGLPMNKVTIGADCSWSQRRKRPPRLNRC